VPSGLIPVLVAAAAMAGGMSYLSAYHQMAHLHVAREARRRALGAAIGPVAFYGCLTAMLWVGVPLMLHT
jgi:hypothetical protein